MNIMTEQTTQAPSQEAATVDVSAILNDAPPVKAETTQTGETPETVKAEVPPTPAKPQQSDTDKAFAKITRELRETKREMARLIAAQSQAQNQPPEIDPLVDPVGYRTQIEERTAKMLADAHLDKMEIEASQKFPDYQEVRDQFIEMAEGNPGLIRDMRQAPNPAEFAYKYVKDAELRTQMGNPAEFAERMKAEGRKEAEAAMQALIDKKVSEALSGALPKTLADVQNQGARVPNPSGWNGPTPLDNILKR